MWSPTDRRVTPPATCSRTSWSTSTGSPWPKPPQRARELVQRWGLDGTRLEEWAARNADGRDNSSGGPRPYTPSHPLGGESPTIDLAARALSDGHAYLTVNVFWERDRPTVS